MLSRASSTLADAVETFARGYAWTRSFTHPYVADRLGAVWVTRDAPRKSGAYRREEWISCILQPAEIDSIARQQTRGRYAICAILRDGAPDDRLRQEFKELGYRLASTEAVMVHQLAEVPPAASPVSIERVTDEPTATRLKTAAGSRQILPKHLNSDAELRQYIAAADGDLVGWVRSVVVGDRTWVSNMSVKPAYRRRGIARAMLCRMLRDDLSTGSKMSVLTASHAGALLYPRVGYARIGTLYLYTPKKT